ncbi:MAG: hypothetical protein LUH14_12900 [Clostridiaceae bacterium]|nr:hypothetical protein [Clostridiaceae bacterium]
MACFIVPAVEAAVTTVATKVMESREKKALAQEETAAADAESKFSFSHKMKWLNHMLWGGSALLAFEHLWHGEVVPYFPFLTAMGNASDRAGMLHEMSTVGVAMAMLVTAVWLGMVMAASAIQKRAQKADEVQHTMESEKQEEQI